MKDGQKIQIHNWIIEKVEMDGVDFMEVRTVTGDFRVMYRIDTKEYASFSNIDEHDKDALKGVEIFLSNVHTIARNTDMAIHFLMMKAYTDELIKRKEQPTSDEEDKQIIAEIKAAYELEQEMKEEKKDEKRNQY